MRNKILVIELSRTVSFEESQQIQKAVRDRVKLKDEDTLFFIESSKVNNIYWVSDNWFTKLVNSFKLKKLLKQIQKENK